MEFFAKHIRGIIYVTAGGLVAVIFFWMHAAFPFYYLRLIRLTEWYGLASAVFLYAALLVSPLYSAFRRLPGKPLAVHARRAIGVSSFFFTLLHSSLGFFGLLKGFAGLRFLGPSYLVASGLGFVGLVIMAAMTATASDYAVRALGKRWFTLHRFVYLGGFAILLHALLLGAHFSHLNRMLPEIFLVALFLLLLLEALRLDKVIRRRYPVARPYSLPAMTLLIALFYFMIFEGHLKHYFGLHIH
jgi:methionine sulfoxide reductase heme-binding subunit